MTKHPFSTTRDFTVAIVRKPPVPGAIEMAAKFRFIRNGANEPWELRISDQAMEDICAMITNKSEFRFDLSKTVDIHTSGI